MQINNIKEINKQKKFQKTSLCTQKPRAFHEDHKSHFWYSLLQTSNSGGSISAQPVKLPWFCDSSVFPHWGKKKKKQKGTILQDSL